MREPARRWGAVRIGVGVIILAAAIANLFRFANPRDAPSDTLTLGGEVVLILIDVALFVSAFKASGRR